MSPVNEFNQDMMDFIQASPTPFHAVKNMAQTLEQNGFSCLDGRQTWQLVAGQRYYQVKNGSSIIAFVYGQQTLSSNGIRMVGAHTDSPCLRVKPNPELRRKGYYQLGVEVYGGVLLNPWFDRDLSLAGRVTFNNNQGELNSALIDFKDPIAVIPSLAIHLDREVNNSRQINAQKDIVPLVKLDDAAVGDKQSFHELLKARLLQNDPQLNIDQVLDFELSFYDTQAPALIGLQQEFIASARLDNLASCYIGLRAIITADNKVSSLLVCNDHEEVGSQSACGALGPMLNDFLRRLVADDQQRVAMIENSLLISADNAHGVHPNFADKHDENHGPLLNKGPVIKVNANQRYATNSQTSALFKQVCMQVGVPVQTFVSRSDMACGSTIGPLTSSEVGVATLDVGIPTFAMHSIRELAGSEDAYSLYQALSRFLGLDNVAF